MDTDAKTPVSLEVFAPKVGRGRTCGACGVPSDVRTEFERARAMDPERFTYRTISNWLKTHDLFVSPDSLRRHFNGGHADGQSG